MKREEKYHKYKLEKGSKTYRCPNCGRKSFKRYIDSETGNYLPEKYGRCNHENKCVPHYHLNPYKDGYDIDNLNSEKNKIIPKRNYIPNQSSRDSQTEIVFFDPETFRRTLRQEGYTKNIFVQNLITSIEYPFDALDVESVISLYYLGTVTHGYRKGAVTFPFIDIRDNVRAIQVKQFDNRNHTISTDFLHSIVEKHYKQFNKPRPAWLQNYLQQEKKVSCLFGEHLLDRFPLNPVALVEAPKTAVYGTLYFGFPQQHDSLIWLAVYNKSSFSFDRLKVLKGRDIIIFPDLSAGGKTYREWRDKAKEIEALLPGTRFVFSDLLERLAPEKDKLEGKDLADFLINLNWKQFRKQSDQMFPHNCQNPDFNTPPSIVIEEVEPFANADRDKSGSTQKPNNNPEIREKIIAHYQSYRMPYSVTDPGDLTSLLSGFQFELGDEISEEEYKSAVLSYLQLNLN